MILIDMKMPHGCGDCPLTYDSFDGSTVCALHPGAYIDWDKRPDYCPLHNLRKDTKETKEESKETKEESKEVDETNLKEFADFLEKTANELKSYLDADLDLMFHDNDTATMMPRPWTIKPSGLDDDFPDVTF